MWREGSRELEGQLRLDLERQEESHKRSHNTSGGCRANSASPLKENVGSFPRR